MATDEKVLNGFIARAMERVAPPGFLVSPEQHGSALQGSTTPDLIVHMPYRLRIIIETEYGNPAVSDAINRLGYQFDDSSALPLRNVLAVGIPRHLGELPIADLEHALGSTDTQFLLQVVTGANADDPNLQVTPKAPVAASIQDLVQYAWLASIPQPYTAAVLNDVIAKLTAAQREFAAEIELHDPATKSIIAGRHGGSGNGLATENQMAAVAGNVVGTLASMVQLHLNLKEPGGNLPEITPLSSPQLWQRSSPHDALTDEVAKVWREIEHRDYKPLSSLVADVLEDDLLSPLLGRTLRAVYTTVRDSITSGISATTNVAAEIWQAMIPDRNQRAAYYTKPITAELLANITTARLTNPGEARYNEICAGTATLARATEENIRFRHYATHPTNPNDKQSIHGNRMAHKILLTDVNQQSVTVATANMASLEPQTPYSTSAIFAITSEGGSLNFLTEKGVSDMAHRMIGSYGNRSDMLTLDSLEADICNNNDPYFRAGAEAGDRNPISQHAMQEYRRLANKRVPAVANATAGLATFMHVIEHELLVQGGVHGKVLPLSAAHTVSYAGLRANIENDYRDVLVISTAAGTGASMSQDTSIQEMLVIGTKAGQDKGDRSITCINLTSGFHSKFEAKMFASAIQQAADSDQDAGDITVGTPVGSYAKMHKVGHGNPWYLVGLAGDFAMLACHASNGNVWNTRTRATATYSLPMTTMEQVVKLGIADARIGRADNSPSPRGAFLVRPRIGNSQHDVLSLWNADSRTQSKLTCEPTHYCISRGDPEEAARVLESASQFHISAELRLSSQAVAAAYTTDPVLGGAGWISLIPDQDGIGEAVTLFLNSTFGLIIRISYGQSAHVGRSRIGVQAAAKHPIPDFSQDSKAAQQARQIAQDNFNELRNLPLERISLAAVDAHRQAIDRTVAQMLGLPDNSTTAALLNSHRRLMCSQTAVHANVRSTLHQLAAAGILDTSTDQA